MTVHSLHIFDRRGKTLFTKMYSPATKQHQGNEEEEQLSEQRKLIYGMLFSLRELVGNVSPEDEAKPAVLHSVRTGANTLHNFETASGLRIAMFTSPDIPEGTTLGSSAVTVRDALIHIYTEIWVDSVIRSPLYRPNCLGGSGPPGSFSIKSTPFERRLDTYLASMTWYR
eukprot:CAMPEP_0198291400 /NCGR_PEP_ID=MMETSP1449-20131203/8941_1 /TAXON_ID=420275 /ORGANISM="Attheya septentrionalis, Strain CCMP2084" /LENGTH=169 /DNA_ID=CAMNT_0043990029 /DNA_START=133 /DNA_END=642 /DNA_ORIENTATION=+